MKDKEFVIEQKLRDIYYDPSTEEVGQLLAKHHGKFARVFSFMRGLLRSEHLCGIKKYGSFRKTRVSGYNTSRK